MKIWCLFSVDNLYDQPQNNLVAYWPEKPSLDDFAGVFLGKELKDLTADQIVGLVGIWTGNGDKMPHHDTAYRLEDVASGRNLSNA